jgi:DNA-binding NarL/FixJ family response regulator
VVQVLLYGYRDFLRWHSVFAVFVARTSLRQGVSDDRGSILPDSRDEADTMARILIADDYDAARRAIRRLVGEHPGWEVCGEAVDGLGAVRKTAQLKPDLVILDLEMGMIDGLTAAREISAAMPCLPIVLCTVFATDTLERESQESGVRAVVNKSEAGTKLVSVMEDLLNRREFQSIC